MSEHPTPKYFYKYKGIRTIEDLERLVDIIKNNRIYIPTRTQLNDPMECKYMPRVAFAHSGNWIISSTHHVDPIVESAMDKYRVLSLSADGTNLQMWAHYSNNYSGVCIEFKNTGELSQAKPVQYLDETPHFKIFYEDEFTASDREKWVLDSYFMKSGGWKYEAEYRILKSKEEKYLPIRNTDIASIVIGHNLAESCRDYIYNLCKEKSIPVYYTWPSDFDYDVHYVDIRAVICKVYCSGENILNYEKGKVYDELKLEKEKSMMEEK